MAFVASKVLWVVARPLTALLILLVAGLGLRRLGWRRAGGVLVGGALAALVTLEFTTLGALALLPLENRFPPVRDLPAEVAGIIVLGGAVAGGRLPEQRDQVILTGSAERMTEAVALSRRRPEARLAFTGFSAALRPEGWSEAEGARRLFAALGVDPARLIVEDRARNTAENARFLKDLVAPRPGETWLLVTSASHMPRAVGCFRQAGWPVLPYPVDYRLPPEVPLALTAGGGLGMAGAAWHEWLGLLAYWLMDRIPEPFPGPASRAATPNATKTQD